MKIKKALEFDNYSLESEVLLCYLLKKDKPWLYSHQDDILTSDRTRRYQKLIFRRKKGEPIAYITHHKEFYGLDFYIDKNVLIPRPETELLVKEALDYCSSEARTKKVSSSRPPKAASNSKYRILDLGTGSGCIIVAIATNPKSLPADATRQTLQAGKILNFKFYATDISQKALKIAQKNAKKHKVKIKFYKSDLFKNIPANLKFNLIIANLPYLWNNYPPFEPRLALDGGGDGLEIIKKFLKQAKNHLNKRSTILLEIDPRQVSKIKKLIKKYLSKKKVSIKKDLAGLDRTAILR